MEIAEGRAVLFYPGSPEGVIRCYQDMVYRIAFTYCKNASDAEDIMQEVFFRYLKNKTGFSNEEHLKAWLIRVTINASKSLLRSAWFRKTTALPEHGISHAPEQVKPAAYYAVLSLPEKYRSVVLLYYYEEYTVGEIAKILRRTETAIQTQLQRARAMLKAKLKEDWEQ